MTVWYDGDLKVGIAKSTKGQAAYLKVLATPALISALQALVPEFGTVDETPELQAARKALKAAFHPTDYVWVIARNGDGYFVDEVDRDTVPAGMATYPSMDGAYTILKAWQTRQDMLRA